MCQSIGRYEYYYPRYDHCRYTRLYRFIRRNECIQNYCLIKIIDGVDWCKCSCFLSNTGQFENPSCFLIIFLPFRHHDRRPPRHKVRPVWRASFVYASVIHSDQNSTVSEYNNMDNNSEIYGYYQCRITIKKSCVPMVAERRYKNDWTLMKIYRLMMNGLPKWRVRDCLVRLLWQVKSSIYFPRMIRSNIGSHRPYLHWWYRWRSLTMDMISSTWHPNSHCHKWKWRIRRNFNYPTKVRCR